MSAKTGMERVKQLNRLSGLTLTAAELVARSRSGRDDGMVDRLLKSLQLFKENQLGEVMRIGAFPDKASNILIRSTPEMRAAFRARIDRFGEWAVEEEFAKGFPPRVRHYLEKNSLRALLAQTKDQVLERGNFGATALAGFEKVLATVGLSINMNLEELEECFGPHLIRLRVHVHKKGSYRPVRGINVVLRRNDGVMHQSASLLNGSFFLLPPGIYTVIEPTPAKNSYHSEGVTQYDEDEDERSRSTYNSILLTRHQLGPVTTTIDLPSE